MKAESIEPGQFSTCMSCGAHYHDQDELISKCDERLLDIPSLNGHEKVRSTNCPLTRGSDRTSANNPFVELRKFLGK